MTASAAFLRQRFRALLTPSGTIAQPNLRGRMPALDGLRGLAVLMVLLFHFVGDVPPSSGLERAIVGVTKYGAYGVELFFVLSGFLITGILCDTRDGPNYFRNFYAKRFLRIFPLYYGVLAIVFFVAPLIPFFRGATLTYLLDRQAWAWLYSVNIYIAQQGWWSFSYLNHFWSLAVEEQFYLFWPLLVFLLARRPRTLVAVSLAVALGAMLARLAGSLLGLSWVTIYTLTPFRLDALALGAFLAVMARRPQGVERLARALPLAAAIIGTLAVATYATRLTDDEGLTYVMPVRAALTEMLLACLLVYALVAAERSAISRFFRSRPMVFLGTYSYGLYVYHHFISFYLSSNRTDLKLAPWLGSHLAAVALQATLGMAASLAVAYVSYEVFEKRFLRLKRPFETGRASDRSAMAATAQSGEQGASMARRWPAAQTSPDAEASRHVFHPRIFPTPLD